MKKHGILHKSLQWAAMGASFGIAIIAVWAVYALTNPWNNLSGIGGKNPGDQIQASHWNGIVGNLENLNERLTSIEAWGNSSKGLTILWSISSTSSTKFNVSEVRSNTLLPTNPTNSQITIAENGAYLLTSHQYTCVPSNGYAGTTILINGLPVASGVSYPNSCDSSSATVFRTLSTGDTVTAQCHNNAAASTTCSFTVIKL